ncbi:hypothetical protein AAEU41_12530 [Pantoea agglomerans]
MDTALAWILYRSYVMTIGLVCIILGYKLLSKGIFSGGADVTAAWDTNKRLIIRRASPGALLFLVGFGVIAFSIFFSNFKQSTIDGQYQSQINNAKSFSTRQARAIAAEQICDDITSNIMGDSHEHNEITNVTTISGTTLPSKEKEISSSHEVNKHTPVIKNEKVSRKPVHD